MVVLPRTNNSEHVMGTQRQRHQSPSMKNSMGTQLHVHPHLAGGSVEMPRSASGRRHINVFPCDLTPILEILQRRENACGNATWYDSAFTYFQTHSAFDSKSYSDILLQIASIYLLLVFLKPRNVKMSPLDLHVNLIYVISRLVSAI